MNFRVETTSETVTLTARQLVEMLVIQSAKPNRPWASASPKLADELTRLLESRGMLRTISMRELVTVAIDTGYYLNTFLRKNNVQLEEDNAIQGPVDGANGDA